MKPMRSRFAIVPGIAFAIISLCAQSAEPAASGQATSAQTGHVNDRTPPQPLPKPTNLQILPKDISGHDLMGIMQGYRKALGVECTFCHATSAQTHKPDFASDAKPDKEIARTMMRMTEEINSKYISTIKDPDATPAERTVTCGTCHRGKTMPAPFTPAAAGAQRQQHEMPMKPE